MSKTKVSTTYGQSLRRYNLTAGYAIFYSVILAGLTLAVSRVFASTSFSFGIVAPEFLYSTHLGLLYIYNVIALAIYAVITIIFPGYLQFPELDNNLWYTYSKFGISTSTLAVQRILSSLVGMLRVYLIGFVLTFLISLIIVGTAGLSIIAVILTFAVGVLSVVLTMCPIFLLASFSHGRLILSGGMLVMSGVLVFLLYKNDYLSPESYETVYASTQSLVSVSLFGLLIITVLLAAVSIPLAISISGRRAAMYNIEELDSETLVALDVRPDLLILEQGKKGYDVAISGPHVNDSDIDIPVPEMRGSFSEE